MRYAVDMLMTDWGAIPLPSDMKALLRGKQRKDGQPDRRFKTAHLWHQRMREDTNKLAEKWA